MWTTITADDVTAEMAPAEVSALQAIQGSADILAGVLAKVTASVRGKIVAADVPLGPPGTIPDQLVTEALDIARWRWLRSFPQLQKLQTKERQAAHDDAQKELQRVQAGEVKIEDPNEDPSNPEAWTILPKIRRRHKTAGPSREDGV